MKKTTIVLAAILLSATLAHANLIDLTPGGFDFNQPWPQPVLYFFGNVGLRFEQLAGANITNGQVIWSPFEPFGDNLFDITLHSGGTGADVAWNLTGTGFFYPFVLVESAALKGNLYRAQFPGDFDTAFVEIDGTTPPDGITFFGVTSVPDAGSTLMLLAVAMATVIFLRRRICT
jgi:hypothetical protein